MVVAVGSQCIFVVHVIQRLRNIPPGKSTVQELAKRNLWSCRRREGDYRSRVSEAKAQIPV